MKNLKICAVALLTLGMAACTSDEPNGSQEANKGDMYARVRIQLPTGTRAGTTDWNGNTNSEDGYEIGQEDENRVNNVTVVLASKESDGSFSYIDHSTTSTLSSSASNTFTMQFDVNALNDYAGQNVYIFTYCNVNPITAPGAFTDLIAGYASQLPWQSGNFIMANAANVTYDNDKDPSTPPEAVPAVTLPSIETLRAQNNTPDNAFDLGTVQVTRVCSRFDYKKGGNVEGNDNAYTIKANDGAEIGEIEMVAMAPVEIAQEYYYIPRISADGTNADWTYCGAETNTNFVVSPNYSLKTVADLTDEILGKYNYRTTGEGVDLGAATYDWTTLAGWNGVDDNDENWNDNGNPGFDKSNYKIWKYVTENTIPGTKAQKAGITTGVLFKAKINSVTNTNFAKAMEGKKAVYSYKGTIYGDLAMMRQTAYTAGQYSELYKAFISVFGLNSLTPKTATDGTGATYIVKDVDGNVSFVETLTDAADNNVVDGKAVFKIYRPAADGNYYVYYIYRNRHNDNDNIAKMGTMEFATVRNNVYKLMVTTVSDFGYAATPGDDPNFPDPDDPDEDPKVYFKVSCRVLPWMVRVNNIEF